MKSLLKKLTPPFIWELFCNKDKYGFFGNYQTWQQAKKKSSGYDSRKIIEKVISSTEKIRSGAALWERDGITFDNKQYCWPIISTLLLSAIQNNNFLSVIDFGGSLGSTYFQYKDLFKNLNHISWNIVEQKNMATYGKDHFANESLKIFENLEEIKDVASNVFLSSSSIQYIENYKNTIEQILNRNFKYIIFDRTPFWDEKETITIQKVSPRIYDASYPARIFNLKNFKKNFLEKDYKILAEVDQSSMSYNRKMGLVKLKHITFVRKS